MTAAVALLAAVGAVNAPRIHAALPEGTPPRRAVVALVGAALAQVGALVLAALAGPALETLGVSEPTARIAAGVVVALVGAWTLVTPLPAPEPALPGVAAAVVPVAFPLLFGPALGFLSLTAAADRGVLFAAVVVAAGLATVVPAALIREPRGPGVRVRSGLGRLVSAVLVLSGIALVMDGIFDI